MLPTLSTNWAWKGHNLIPDLRVHRSSPLSQQALTKWHPTQRTQMTQNKHKATHDQLIETEVPLSEAWHSLLQWFSWVRHWSASYFRLFYFGTPEHWYTCWEVRTSTPLWFLTVGHKFSCVQTLPSLLSLLRVQFFGRPLLLGLPQVTGDGDGVHTGRHGFGWDLTELLPVRVVLVQALDHLGCDAPWPDPS